MKKVPFLCLLLVYSIVVCAGCFSVDSEDIDEQSSSSSVTVASSNSSSTTTDVLVESSSSIITVESSEELDDSSNEQCDEIIGCILTIGTVVFEYESGDTALLIKGNSITQYDFTGNVDIRYMTDESNDELAGQEFDLTETEDKSHELIIPEKNEGQIKGVEIAFWDDNGRRSYVIPVDISTDDPCANWCLLLEEPITFPIEEDFRLSSRDDQCRSFNYGSCPESCEEHCTSSGCSYSIESNTWECDGDCGGIGSCVEKRSSALLELEQNRELWNRFVGETASRITYSVFKGCNCMPESTGPFDVSAAGNTVHRIFNTVNEGEYFSDGGAFMSFDGLADVDYLQLSVNDLFQEVENELERFESDGYIEENSEYKGIEYHTEYGYPMKVNIGPTEVDGGLNFSIDSMDIGDDPRPILDSVEMAYKEWVYDTGGSATYTFYRSCYCLVEDTGPFIVTLESNEVTSVEYSGVQKIAITIGKERYSDFSIMELFSEVDSGIKDKPYGFSVTYDSEFPFPTHINRSMSPMIADAGFGITISDIIQK
ncbi:MAG: DUF6174 domain-containing protein [Fibrobacterales bacterium]